MKTRTILILSAVLVVLFLGIRAGDYFRNRRAEYSSILARIDIYQIDRIEIAKQKNTICLRKMDNNWVVATSLNYPADTPRINSILKQLNNVHPLTLVTQNKSKYSIYGIDEHAAKITIFNKENKPWTSFYIGKNSQTAPNNVYYREDGSDNVYLLTKNLNDVFPATVRDWLKKDIWQFQEKDVTGVQRITSKEKITIQLKDGTWTMTEPLTKNIDINLLPNLTRRIVSIQPSDVSSETAPGKTGLDSPVCTYRVNLQNNQFEELRIGNLENENHYARMSNSNQTIFIPKYTVENINKEWDNLARKEEPKPGKPLAAPKKDEKPKPPAPKGK